WENRPDVRRPYSSVPKGRAKRERSSAKHQIHWTVGPTLRRHGAAVCMVSRPYCFVNGHHDQLERHGYGSNTIHHGHHTVPDPEYLLCAKAAGNRTHHKLRE